MGTRGNDRVDGNTSDHKRHFLSTDGNDTILTFRGNDRIEAGDGDDLIDAGSGNDRVRAGDGNDNINAGSGIDKVAAGSGNDTIQVSGRQAEHDKMGGGDGEDSLELIGGDDVRLFGFDADNSSIEALVTNGLGMVGSHGADKFDFSGLVSVEGTLTVNGGRGADRITGSAFDDLLSGGRHGDRFIFEEAFGDDKIMDFGDRSGDQDVIKLVGYGAVLAADFDAWKADHVSIQNGKVVITLDQGTITLDNVSNVSTLGFNDFLFT
jgi:Ca2+-binding RTX toxin-like protein